jgi:hypothetical protein
MAWVSEVASITIRMCRLTHFLMVLYNVPVSLKLIVLSTVCSNALQNHSANSAVLQYKLYSLCSTTVQTVFPLKCYTTNYSLCSTTLHTVPCKLCNTTVPSVFTLQYYIKTVLTLHCGSTNCIHSAVL